MQKHRIPYLVLTCLTLAALVAGILPIQMAQAQSTTASFAPLADAYINKASPDSNYGSNTSIRVDGDPTMNTYLTFEVKSLNGAAIQSAKLRIFANSENKGGLSVRRVSDTGWSESKIKFSNAPAIGGEIKSSPEIKSNDWIEVDVTSAINGEGAFSLALVGKNATQINLAAREDKDHAPKLVITLGGSAPAPTETQPAPQPTNPPAPTEPAPQPTNPVAPTQPAATQPGTQPTNTPAPTQPAATQAPTQPPSSGNDPIVFFQGDLVSSSSVARAQKVVALIKSLMAQHPNTQILVASTGDNEQENAPTVSDYQQYFGTTFGTFVQQGIFMQVRGNHDVQDSGHGAAYAQYFGSNAHINFSYNLGTWHLTGIDQLNGSVNQTALSYLKSDLAANASASCKLVYWHVPTYSSGAAHGDSTGLKALNQAEYDAGVDIQINGHDHHYQRFYPINPSGVRDDAKGITTFIDGIGGQDGRSGSQNSVAQAASAKYLDTFPGGEAIGTIMFTLHTNSADYKVYNANDGSVVDSGTVNCKGGSGQPAPTTAPTVAPTTAPTTAPTSGPSQTPAPTQAPTQPPVTGSDPQPSFPIRAAFYYPWFPEGWNQQGYNPFTNYHPTLGYYSAADLATAQKQIGMMQYGGMQAGIASWWGQGSSTDVKIPNLLKAASGTPFRWALYYENESMGDPSPAQITNDLTYIRDHYGKDPSFLRVNGKFVVFVYANTNDVCGMADRWKQGNTVGAYIVLKVFAGYGSCASQPDSWHQYSPAVASDQQGSLSYVISPGFWKKGDAVRLARDPQRWASNVDAWSKAAVKWQLVTTFNEWGEGTSVEPATEWSTTSGYGYYLDLLHVATSGGTPPPAPTAAPTTAPTQPPATQPTATQPPAPQPTNPPAPTTAPTQPAPQPTATQPGPAPTTPATCSSVTLTKGPTLILTGNNTQMRVFWQWSANPAFTLQWGTSTSYGSSASVSAKDTTNHLYQYDIGGLTPGTKYYYRVVTGSQCAFGSFNAAPDASASSVKFFSYGDTRSNGSTHNTVAGQVDTAFAADPAFQTLNLNVGDWVSGDSESAWTGEWFATSFTNIRKQNANIADIGVRGNHESGATYWKRYWPEPFQSGGLYWSFDYGPMHVAMLDQYTSYTPGSAQYNWLKADLAASTKTWKMVVLHEPGWSASGGHANNTSVQQNLQPLFTQYGVSIVFGGHNHYYARASVGGITHLTMGGGGAPSYTPASGQPNIVKTYQGSSFGKFSISGNTLTAQILSGSGSVVDTFTITR